MWQHDYLHLRPLREALATFLAERARGAEVLDLGCGRSPYRALAPQAARWVRVDVVPAVRPDAVARGEALPFRAGAFDVVLSTQILGLVDDPTAVGREVARVLRPGGTALVTTPAAWPYDSAAVEHRFGVREVAAVLPGLAVRDVRALGGMLGLPFSLLNIGVRELTRSAERRLGTPAALLRAPASLVFLASNLCGRALERLAAHGPLSTFLTYLDDRLPTNLLVIAERRP